MRYKDYLKESEFFSTDNWDQLHTALDKKCKPYIKELKGAKNLLVRGVKPNAVPQFMQIRAVRKNRKPRVIGLELHDRLGDYSKEHFGWNFRTEGLFTSKSKADVDRWGHPVIIFPIGNFKYVWNNDVYELYEQYDNWAWSYDDDVSWRIIRDELSEYKTTNLNQYLKSPVRGVSECIINCDKYYSINMEWYETLLKYYA